MSSICRGPPKYWPGSQGLGDGSQDLPAVLELWLSPYDGDRACPAPGVPQLLAELLNSVKWHAPLDVHLHTSSEFQSLDNESLIWGCACLRAPKLLRHARCFQCRNREC